MVSTVFNYQHPIETQVSLPDGHGYPQTNWKNARMSVVLAATNTLVRHVLEQMPLVGGFRHTLVDVKVQNLSPDIRSCRPGWHLDGALYDQHHLFIMGGAPTEFLDHNITFTANNGNKNELGRQIPWDAPVRPIPLNTICSYTGQDFHRGVLAPKPLQRLLIRVTETNTVVPHDRPRDPAVGAV